MDTLGILGQVLECSVCLEILDSSSRVLPCQHTFCKACLLDVINTNKELRCPECRALVTVPFDSLLPNILLMRILEGIKIFPQACEKEEINSTKSDDTDSIDRLSSLDVVSSLDTGASSVLNCSEPSNLLISTTNVPSMDVSAVLSNTIKPSITNLNPFWVTPLSEPITANLANPGSESISALTVFDELTNNSEAEVTNLEAKALFDFQQNDQRDLSFKKGDIIKILMKIDDIWYFGKINGIHGIVPASYIKILQPQPVNVPLCKALFDFKIGSSEEKTCLHFNKGEIITLIRKIDENWLEGKLTSSTGIFPQSFVKMNSAARKFLKLPPRLDQSDDEFYPIHSAPVTSSTTNCSLSSTTSASTVLTRTYQKPIFSTNMISQNLLLSTNKPSSRNSFAGYSSRPPSLCTAPICTKSVSTDILPIPKENKNINSANLMQGTTDSANFAKKLQMMGNLKIYVSVFGYHPKKADELEIIKGRLYIVTEKCQDGWYKGQCITTDKVGVFPGNYVQLAKEDTVSAYFSQIESTDPLCYLRNSVISSSNESRLSKECSVKYPEWMGFSRCSSTAPDLPMRQDRTTNSSKYFNNDRNVIGERSASSSPILNGNEKKSSSGGLSLIKKLTRKNSKSSPVLTVHNTIVESTPQVLLLKNGVKSHGVSPKHSPVPLIMERYRCIVAYPPNGEHEIELKIGDLVYVHNKRADGWFKGTHQKSGKTGLFPASFVELC